MSKFRFSILVLCSLVLVFSCQKGGDKAGWTELFNGTDLSGWIQKGGDALYTIEDNMIVGTTVANTENSFLSTEKLYGDFILELEVMVDTSLNSGIQIRSNQYLNGRVHGYQVEIDPSARSYSGGIYDEARRAWLYDLSQNDGARTAFNMNGWNQYRIEAIGNSIKTWINGVMCANLIDEANDSGFISLQVHSVDVERRPWTEGVQVRWRNIRILTGNLEEERIMEAEEATAGEVLLTNRLSPQEKEEGWQLLFDGKTSQGWRGAYSEEFPESGWAVEDGELKVQTSGGGESIRGGDIVTERMYSDFDLRLDFKLTPGANSGIKYYVTQTEGNEGSAIGLEYQILDDELNADAFEGFNGNHTLASLYDMIPAVNRRVAAVGQWNMARIVSKDNHVEHWLNESKVLEYEIGSEAYRELVANSKYKVWDNFGEAGSGYILLQEHGNNVSFRNIKILEF